MSVSPGLARGGRRLYREAQTSLSPITSSSPSGGTPRRSQESWKMYFLQHVLVLPRGPLPVDCAWNTSPSRDPGGILVKCPNYLIWLLLMQRGNGSVLNPSWLKSLPFGGSWFLPLVSMISFFWLLSSIVTRVEGQDVGGKPTPFLLHSALFTKMDPYTIGIPADATSVYLSKVPKLLHLGPAHP